MSIYRRSDIDFAECLLAIPLIKDPTCFPAAWMLLFYQALPCRRVLLHGMSFYEDVAPLGLGWEWSYPFYEDVTPTGLGLDWFHQKRFSFTAVRVFLFYGTLPCRRVMLERGLNAINLSPL